MEQNNFEKNIQQKLDELKIPPSGSVWTNIEKRIGRKHKHRKVFFMFFFLFLFLLSGGYWLFNSTKNNTRQQNHSLSHLLEDNHKQTLSKGKQANNQDSSSGHSIVSSKTIFEATDTKIKATSTIIESKAEKSIANREQEKTSIKEVFTAEDKMISSSSQNRKLKIEKKIDADKGNELSDHDNQQKSEDEITEANNENNISDKADDVQNKIAQDSLFKRGEGKSVVKNLSKDLQKHKWVLGVTFSGGMSFMSNEWLNTDNNNNSDYQSMPNSGVGNSGSGSVSRLPAKTTNSKAFIAGAFIEKNISKKGQISLGINYKYFSTINKTGSKIDSVQLSYNSATYTKTYRNNFNYLELPVSLKFRLTNDKTLPVYWLAGINISQLISSNALQFKSNPGIYYRDNSLFNKTQWGFSAGFSATLFSQENVTVNIGPYFYYNASRLANEGLYDKKHFNFIGVRAEILFGNSNR